MKKEIKIESDFLIMLNACDLRVSILILCGSCSMLCHILSRSYDFDKSPEHACLYFAVLKSGFGPKT